MRSFWKKLIPQRSPPLPVLGPRPRPLTPCDSDEDLRQKTLEAASGSPFFQKLPYEIRRRILIEAFGGHIVHMDLWYDHPELPIPEDGSKIRQKSHCGRHIDLKRGAGYKNLMRDKSAPKRWIWQGSECHRNLPWYRHKSLGYCWWGWKLQPSEDLCQSGGCKLLHQDDLNACEQWRGKDWTGCFIGAMGWLQSCRQAYVEGLEVLYTTNTIHSVSKVMLLNLDKLLLPQRISSIKSAELVWTFDPYPGKEEPSKEPCMDMGSFHRFLEAVTRMFTGIQILHISIQGKIFPSGRVSDNRWALMSGEKGMDIIERDIMVPVGVMASQLGPQVREVTLAFSVLVYRKSKERALKEKKGAVEEVHLGAVRERHWRGLEGVKGTRNQLDGYWVQLGQRNIVPERSYMTHCSVPPEQTPPEEEVFKMPPRLWRCDLN